MYIGSLVIVGMGHWVMGHWVYRRRQNLVREGGTKLHETFCYGRPM